MKKYVGITACPTGIAHTYMAAEKLEETAKETGNQIKVETQGSIGVENELTADDILMLWLLPPTLRSICPASTASGSW